MKKTLLSILFLCLLGTACKKENKVTPGVSATVNGDSWVANSFETSYQPLNTKDMLYIHADNGEQHLVIILKQVSKGVFELTDKTVFFITVGYDVLVSEYKLDTTANNMVTITTYNEKDRQLKGSFNLSLKNTRIGTGYPDQTVFAYGKFNILL